MNHLKHALSPYLQQHANNPVDWYPWGPEALSKAQQENKPILLSIGYAACHWCHVMAHESFEDEATAAVMNAHFINIKVDREERPDLDRIYQTAHQLLNRESGGWPLTAFLTPRDQMPFFSGTYFPKQNSFGRPAFKDVLLKIAEIYAEKQEEIIQQHAQLISVFRHLSASTSAPEVFLTEEPIELALDQLEEEFDAENGGFGHAPKFPAPMNLQRLLRRKQDTPQDKNAIEILELTLDKMARGGIYDQLGGGFFRYSVDEKWMIPHFEKMLYDNALLLALYARAYALSGKPLYKTVVEETANWIFRKMQAPAGGYYSTLDADSCGIEGKYYYWSKKEIESVLSAEEFNIFSKVFALDGKPNFADHYHLYQKIPLCFLDRDQKVFVDAAKTKLLKTRGKRIQPGRDDKILTSWNALMIRGLSISGLILQKPEYIDSAVKTLDFLKNHLWVDGRLFTCYKDKQAYQPAFLDDYAFLIDAILFSLQAHWSNDHLAFALQLAETLIEYYYDEEAAGFYFTAKDAEPLIQRPKVFMDEALPSGNGVAVEALNRLAYLSGETRYIHIAENTLKSAWESTCNYPTAHNSMVHALEEYLYPPEIVILRGNAQEIQEWRNALIRKKYNLHRLIFCIPDDIPALPACLADYQASSHTLAYICQNFKCMRPVENIEDLIKKTI